MRLRAIESAHTFDKIADLYNDRAHKLRNPPMLDARSISPHNKPYITIRPIELGYACCYHDTDVVVWKRYDAEQARLRHTAPGDYVTVCGWPSASTEAFADALTPTNLRFILHYAEGYFVRVDNHQAKRVYEFEKSITFRVEGGVARPVDYTTTKAIDGHSPLLRAALTKTNYFAFMNYARAHLSLDTRPLASDEITAWVTPGAMMDLLADPDKWPEIVFSRSFGDARQVSHMQRLEYLGQQLRAAIYKHHNAVVARDVEFFDWSQFQSQLLLRRRYPWAL